MDDKELSDLMQVVGQKCLQIIDNLKNKPTQLPNLINQYIELTKQYLHLLDMMLKNPEKLWQMQLAYWEDVMHLAQAQFNHWLEGTPMPIQDNRFNHEDWLHNPFFNMLSQQYLLASEHFNKFLETLEHDDKHVAKRIRFFSKQYLDALSPSNFIHTNPQLLSETIQSKGKNLIKGLHNLLNDIDHDAPHLNIKMTDHTAFKVGGNLAVTPGKVIFRNDLIELIQYTPQTAKVRQIPLLLIPPWINKYYILDLSPNNSLVDWLVKQGISVFIISWINPDSSYANMGLYDYLNFGPLAAIETIKKQLGVTKVNTLGFCIGGTLQALMLAYNKAHKDNSVRSATFLASLMDFADPGDISVFIDEEQISKIEREMQTKGYLSGKVMASSFNSLRANDLIWSFFVKHYLSGKNPMPFDILYWNGDSTNMPATMHSQYLRWMYLENNLVKPKKIKLNHTPIDVTKITTPSFFLSTDRDHIAPWQSTFVGYQMMQGPKRFVLGGSGHIAGIINPASSNKYGYKTNDSDLKDPEKWVEHAKDHTGSWWPEWLRWLNKYSGSLVPAPDWTQLPIIPLMDAPGRYVLMKS